MTSCWSYNLKEEYSKKAMAEIEAWLSQALRNHIWAWLNIFQVVIASFWPLWNRPTKIEPASASGSSTRLQHCAGVHQFFANILVFININPFLYINNQFALFISFLIVSDRERGYQIMRNHQENRLSKKFEQSRLICDIRKKVCLDRVRLSILTLKMFRIIT